MVQIHPGSPRGWGDAGGDVLADVSKGVGNVLSDIFKPVGKAIGALDIPTPNVNIGVSDTVYAGIRAQNAASAARGVEAYDARKEAQMARDQAKNAADESARFQRNFDVRDDIVVTAQQIQPRQNDFLGIDPLGFCSLSADGGLSDCPPVKEIEGGVFMQGAKFNGLQTNFVSAGNMETLANVIGIVDSATQTDVGQAILVGGQEAGGMEVNLIVNSGSTTEDGGQRTFTSAGQVIGTSFVDTAETLNVGVLGGQTSTGHGFVTENGVATVAEKVIHELIHATNPNQSEAAVQGLSNTIHREMGNRQIIHGR